MKKTLRDYTDDDTVYDKLVTVVLDTFFSNNSLVYRNMSAISATRIAKKLIKDGECIIAKSPGCLWHGITGAYIKVSIAEDAVDCHLHKLDPKIYESTTFKATLSNMSDGIESEIRKLKSSLNVLEEEKRFWDTHVKNILKD